MSEEKIVVNKENTPAFEKRRKLLKASVVSPLIATLPSGVAQATASAFQCVGGDFSVRHTCPSSAVPPPDGIADEPDWLNGNSCGSDEAVRTVLTVYYEPTVKDGVTGCWTPKEAELIYELPDGTLHHGEGHGGVYVGGYVKPDDGWVPIPNPGPPGELCYAGKSEVLVMYEISEDNTSAEEKGVWPEYTEEAGFDPLTGSCLTSIVDQGALTDASLL